MTNVLGKGEELFNFSNELAILGLKDEDFDRFVIEEEDAFSDYSLEDIQKIYILQEKALINIRELGIQNNQIVMDAFSNLTLNL